MSSWAGRGRGRAVGAHIGDQPDRALAPAARCPRTAAGPPPWSAWRRSRACGTASCCRVQVMNGRRGAALALALVDPGDRPGGGPRRLGSAAAARALVAEDELLLLADRVAGVERPSEAVGGQVGLDVPVLRGTEGVDLALAVDDQPERRPTGPGRRTGRPDLAPQQRATAGSRRSGRATGGPAGRRPGPSSIVAAGRRRPRWTASAVISCEGRPGDGRVVGQLEPPRRCARRSPRPRGRGRSRGTPGRPLGAPCGRWRRPSCPSGSPRR